MSAPGPTFLWYDYETSGTDWARDRIMQFGAVRTDPELQVLGEPLCLYCRPPRDFLPHPAACLLTGISPQKAEREGLPEHAFAARLHGEFSLENSCAVGYNSVGFDRHFTRHLFYRNLYDPYAHEWQGGNSSWDLLDVMRLCRALRPEGIHWPDYEEESRADFRLESLGAANLERELRSHDALGDVQTTLELARLLRAKQPRLFDYALRLRDAKTARQQLPLDGRTPVLHVATPYGNARCCTSLALPLCEVQSRRHAVAMFDLCSDARAFLDHDVGAVENQYSGAPGLHLLYLNRCPLFAPANMLDDAAAERLGIDREHCQEQLRILSQVPDLERRVQQLWPQREEGGQADDPELSLYGGGFLDDRDLRLLEQARGAPPEHLGQQSFDFKDPRLVELLFRWRARNFPETLDEEELQRWEEYRYRRLTDPEGGGSIVLEEYLEMLERLQDGREIAGDASRRAILGELQEWADIVTA